MPPQAGAAFGVKRPRSTVAPQKRILTAFWSGVFLCRCFLRMSRRGTCLCCAVSLGLRAGKGFCCLHRKHGGSWVWGGWSCLGGSKCVWTSGLARQLHLGKCYPLRWGCWYVPPCLVTHGTYPGCFWNMSYYFFCSVVNDLRSQLSALRDTLLGRTQ